MISRTYSAPRPQDGWAISAAIYCGNGAAGGVCSGMREVNPRNFLVDKQEPDTFLCGFHCMRMLRENFPNELHPALRTPRGLVSRRWGIMTDRFEELCGPSQKLQSFGLKRVVGDDLARYLYGIAMTAFPDEGKLWTHYVVFFTYGGEVYIADPHPKRPVEATKLHKTKFPAAWMTEKDDSRWATEPTNQAAYWPGPGWAMGRLLGA